MWSYIRTYFRLRQIKSNRAKLKKLTLSNDKSDPIRLVQAVADNTSIQTLRVEYRLANFSPSLWNALLEVIGKNQTLQVLDFSLVGLGDEAIQTLAPYLKKNQNLRKLNLSKNNITAIGATAVADILTGPNKLKKLVLSGNPLGKGLNDIFQALQENTQLVSLIISDKWKPNGVDDTHIDALVEMIKLNKTLKQLHLCGNQFSDQGIQKLCQGLSMNNTLNAVNLDSSTIGDKGWLAIGEWVGKTISLQSLSVGNEIDKEDTITEAGLTGFLSAFKLNTSIKHLSISFKKDSDVLAIKIAEILKTNHTLEGITLKNCPHAMKQQGVEALVKALKTNTSVCQIEEGELVKVKPSPDQVKPETATELQRLLTRNRLIKAIKENPSALPQLLKNVSYALLDEVFFATVIKLLSEPLLIQHEQLLGDLMEKRQGRLVTLKMRLGLYQGYSGIQSVLNLLAHQAQMGDARSQMALGYLYKNQLLHQSLDPDQAKACFALATAAEDKTIAAHAHFETGHINFFYTHDYQRASEHFDKAVINSRENDRFIHEQACQFRSYTLNNLSRNNSLILPNEKIREAQLNHFHQKQELLSSIKEFFASLNKTLSKGQLKPSFIRTHQTLRSQNDVSLTSQNTNNLNLKLKG